jgi:predicted porin
MMRKGFLRAAVFAALFAGLAAAASAQVTVSGGFAISSMSVEVGSQSKDGQIGFGGNVFVDYLLPIGIPLSLGLEAGYDTASISDDSLGTLTGYAIPLLLRVAYHFDLMANLDLYLVGKIGYAFGGGKQGSYSEDGVNGIGFGVDVGAAYYFTSRIGVFAEAGYERYGLEKDVNNITWKFPFSRFVIVGISAKF